MSPIFERVVLVVVDGLRMDAVTPSLTPTLQELGRSGALSLSGRTVLPSVTCAAMTSLFTGVAPEIHGIRGGFAIPPRNAQLLPVPRLIREAGMPTSGYMHRVPLVWRWMADRIARSAGFTRTGFAPADAHELVSAAIPALREQGRGLVFLHLPDADRAGHAHGWMSRPYLDAVRRADAALARLAAEALRRPGTLLVLLADHGGGGANPLDHDSLHPLDMTIPLLIAGAGSFELPGAPHLLDVPPTVLHALGVRVPASYPGASLLPATRLMAA